MIDGVPIPNIETLTPVGLYIMLVLLLYFERIVPIGRVRAEQATSLYWRDAAEKKQATIEVQAEALKILAEGVGTTVEKVMTTIQNKAEVDQ